MKKLLITLLLISPFSFADTGKTISLECKLTEFTESMYMTSEQYKNDYSMHIAMLDAKAAKALALSPLRVRYNFTLKGIEVDKDVDTISELNGFLVGYEYKWKPSNLKYNNYVGLLWTYATINREDLTYMVTQIDMGQKEVGRPPTFDGKCKVIQLETKF